MHKASGEDEVSRRLKEKLWHDLGTDIVAWLDEPTVIEIMINPDGSVWVERLGQPMLRSGTIRASKVEAIVGTVASILRTEVHRDSPILEGEMPWDGSRLEVIMPPVTSAPTVTIRRKALAVFSLDEYVTMGVMSQTQRQRIHQAVVAKENILIIGGTGSGKTTLVNAVIREIVDVWPEDRLVIIEDTNELQCTAQNYVPLRSRPTIGMDVLLKATMRLRPDRIIVGEVRGAEALSLCKAWNTGHPGGAATVHANSARGGLTRIEQLVAEGSQSPQPAVIAEAINLLVFMRKTPERGRVLEEMLVCNGYADGEYKLSVAV